ncbi:hypothetical protein D3C73_1437600 [compost metagenome]
MKYPDYDWKKGQKNNMEPRIALRHIPVLRNAQVRGNIDSRQMPGRLKLFKDAAGIAVFENMKSIRQDQQKPPA